MSSQFDVRNRYHSQGVAAGGSALLDAVNKGKVHLAKFILDAGEDDVVNTRDFKGKTPLIRACYIKEEKTRERTIQLLLNKKCDVNMSDDCKRTALSYACELRCNDVVRALVKNNVNPDIPDIAGNTALIYCAQVGNDIAIDILIRCFRRLGLDVDHVNDEGMSALLVAAKNGFIGCATILASDGKANVSLRDPQNRMTAEDWARMRGASSDEVFPFAVGANLRLSRCGSMYTARRAAELYGEGPSLAQLKSDAILEETGDGSGVPKTPHEHNREGSDGLMGAGEAGEASDDINAIGSRFVYNLPSRRSPRKKRHSLPSIKLWSSLDLPTSRTSTLGSTVAEEIISTSSSTSMPVAVESTAAQFGRTQHPPQSKMAARRRCRELARAETEFSRSFDHSLD